MREVLAREEKVILETREACLPFTSLCQASCFRRPGQFSIAGGGTARRAIWHVRAN